MIFEAILSFNTLIYRILDNLSVLNKSRKDFISEIMFLFIGISGRKNFSQFGRYGNFGEQRYRIQFEKQFNFLEFNKEIVDSYCDDELVIAFDPSYISKSGKKTPGLDKFWSGVAGAAKFGLEIGGIAAIDINNKTAFHLEAIQTPTYKNIEEKGITLVDYYADIIVQRKEILLQISNYLVADAYFSKKPFADKIIEEAQMHLISRLRKDADLLYLYIGKSTGKRGRPKKYNGKINLKKIDKQYFELVHEDEASVIYTAIVYSKGLKRNIKLVYELLKNKKNKSYLLFFSTDISLVASKIRKYYKKRFQIEFLYRDGKQHTGLNDCQARSENKLHFHFNASLTAINLAKVEYWLSIPKEKRGAFSMANIKTLFHNTLLLKRFFKVFAIPAYKLKNKEYVKELLFYGYNAA